MIVELIEILTPNIMAVLLLLGMVKISKNIVTAGRLDEVHLKIFMFLQGAVLVTDTLNRAIEGMSGQVVREIVIVTNYILFLCDVLLTVVFILFIMGHVYGFIHKSLRICSIIILACAVLLLLINCFNPIIFRIDSSNCYSNGPVYGLFVAVIFMELPAGIIVYMTDKKRIGTMEFFSPVLFALPLILGEVLSELCIDKVSTILPMFTVSAVFMFISLLHEAVYRDKLTGLYNRFYMDQIIMKKNFRHKSKASKTALMMDLNHFKFINDQYGHAEGDAALINTGDLLAKSVVGKGKAIRYAGDEFIVILFTKDVNEVEKYITELRESVETLNRTSGKPYEISLSIGYSVIDSSFETSDALLTAIDRKMYEDKKAFYEAHKELNRRK